MLPEITDKITEEDTKIKMVCKELKSIGFKIKDMKFEAHGKSGRPDIVITHPYTAIIEVKSAGKRLDYCVAEQGFKYVNDWPNTKIVYITNGKEVFGYNPKTKKPYMINGKQVNTYLLDIVKDGYITPVIVKHTKQDLLKLFKWAEDLLRDKEGLNAYDRFIGFADLLFVRLLSNTTHVKLPDYAKDIATKKDPQEIKDVVFNIIWPILKKEYGDIFRNKGPIIKNADVLSCILKQLYKFDFTQVDIDIKGECFEYFLRNIMTGGDLGQHFTPRHIVSYMVELSDIKANDIIYDPACGTGGFLIVAFKKLQTLINNDKTELEKIRKNLIGSEFNEYTCRISKMNMILAGDGHSNIKQQDTLLTSPIKANVILENPPFGLNSDAFKTGYYSVKTKMGDSLFIQHSLKSLLPEGRLVIIVPNGILFRQDYKHLREWVVNNYKLEKIISLPKDTFNNTTISTSILLITTGKTDIIEHSKYGSNKSTKIHISEYKNTWELPIETKTLSSLKHKTLKELFNISKGDKKAKNNKEGDYPLYVCSKNIKTIDAYTHDTTAILISSGGNPIIHFINGKFSASTDVFILEYKTSEVFSKYIYYYLFYNMDIIGKLFKGIAIKHLSKTNLMDVKIPMIPLNQQKIIIDKFDTSNEMIVRLRQKADKIEFDNEKIFNDFLKN